MHPMERVFVLASIGVAATGSSEARAEGMVSRVCCVSDGWAYTPTLSGSGTTVESILALRLDGCEVGANISSVWFRRVAGSWAAHAWENSESQAAVVRYVTEQLAISVRTQSLWPVAPASTAASGGTMFTDGLFCDDAMLSIVQCSSDPRALLDSPASAGSRVAALQPELADVVHGCSQTEVLDLIAAAIVTEVNAAPGHEGEWAAVMFASLETLVIGFLPCVDWDFSVLASPWCTGCAPTPWVVESGPTLNLLHCAVTCSYSCTATCTWSRWVVTLNWDCTTCQCFQTKTVSRKLYRPSTFYLTPPACGAIPAGFVCSGPDDPMVRGADSDAPGPGSSWFGWSSCPCD